MWTTFFLINTETEFENLDIIIIQTIFNVHTLFKATE